MSRTLRYDSQGRDITCMKEFDALKYPCDECDVKDCDERAMNKKEEKVTVEEAWELAKKIMLTDKDGDETK